MCSGRLWPRFSMNMEPFDPSDKAKSIREMTLIGFELCKWSLTPWQNCSFCLKRSNPAIAHWLFYIPNTVSSQGACWQPSGGEWGWLTAFRQTPVNNSELNWHMLPLKGRKQPDSRFCFECMCKRIQALLLVLSGLIWFLFRLSVPDTQFPSSGQVKPRLSTLWLLVGEEYTQINREKLDVHRSLHNQQSKSISLQTLLKR